MRRLVSWLLRLVRRGPSGARTAQGGVVTSEVTTPPEQVEAYWTDERVRGATPREQRLDPPQS
ncbi:MAG TPA: hypothetical protein VFV76_14565 [Actinomycetes bacterium]|nr:hypothetical protein [Actinomycetes bacterium]